MNKKICDLGEDGKIYFRGEPLTNGQLVFKINNLWDTHQKVYEDMCRFENLIDDIRILINIRLDV